MTLGKQPSPAETAPAFDSATVPAGRARNGLLLAVAFVLAAVMALAAPEPATAAGHAPEKAAGKAPDGGEKGAEAAVARPQAKEPDLDAIKESIGRGEFEQVVTALKSLAYKGNAEAQVLLGDLYMEGRGVYHNYSMAGNWYRRAADADYAEAQFKLAAMYRNGIGVPLYPKQAREWLVKAAEQGHREARARLRRLGVEPPPIKARKPEKAAPEKGEQDKADDQAAAEKVAAKAVEKALEKTKVGEVMDTMAARTETAAKTMAKLAAEAGKGPAQDRIVVTFEGQEMVAGFTGLDPELREVFQQWVAAVNAKDLTKLKQLMGPEYAACANQENKQDYHDFLARAFGFKVTPGYSAKLGNLRPEAPLPFPDLVRYPLRPNHYLSINLINPPHAPGAERVELGASIIQNLIKLDGKWSLSVGCPTPAGIAKMRAAGRGGPKGQEGNKKAP